MRSPKVSIIVPIYNVELYLRDCLNSIVSQTFQNLEIILVDDGSQDKCGEICDEYSNRDQRIKVIHKNNQGLSSARNAGLDVATGDYISFVDSDDMVSSIFIETLLSVDTDISQCGYAVDAKRMCSHSEQAVFEYLSAYKMNELLCTEGSAANTVVWSKLWRRECFDDIRFPVGRLHEDEFVTWRACWNAKHIARTEAPLYYYRQRSDSIMHTGNVYAELDFFDALRERQQYFSQIKEKRLEMLTKTVLVYALREIDTGAFKDAGISTKELSHELRKNFLNVLMSPQIKLTKKANITLHTLTPKVYRSIRSMISK